MISHLLIVSLCAAVAYCAAPTCIGPDGKSVDWYSAYKMPKIRGTPWSAMVSGAALVYQDVNAPGKWKRLDTLINATNNPFGLTIAPIYDKTINESLLYALYNDQPPPDRSSPWGCGHAKGLIIFNSEGGIWLVHSIPGFPSRPHFEGEYQYPSSGHLNGQSILCITLPIKELDNVAKLLYYDNVFIYDKNVPDSIMTGRPSLALMLNPNASRPAAPYYSTLDLTTVGGVTFKAFAKDTKFRKELYADDVAPALQTSLLVEGWRNGERNIASNCTITYKVTNVASIHFDVPNDLDKDIQFETLVDHSKWAVSGDEAKPWICIGDINRQYGQFGRGGGTVCSSDKQMWRSYRDLVQNMESCPV